MLLFQIEVLSCFQMTYVVEAKDAETANALFIQKDLDDAPYDEIDQKHIGILNFSTKKISRSEFKKLAKHGMNGHLGDRLIIKSDTGEAT